jgi:cation transport ATPase
MLLDVGILLSIYIGAKLFENKGKQLKNKKLVKPVVKENLTVQTQALLEETTSDVSEKKHDHYLIISIASIGLAAIGKLSPPLGILSVGAVSYASLPILKQAEKSLITEGKIRHDMLISILTSLALFTGQVFALSVGILFYHIYRKVLAKTQDHSKKVLSHLCEQQSHKVWILRDKIEIEVPLEAVQVNDIVVVNIGEFVPVDGIIIDGMARIDQHSLTGESKLVEKGVGESVFASTSVISGKIKVKVEKTAIVTDKQPEVEQIIVCDDYNENELLSYAATVEARIKHPIAKAILKKANEFQLTLPDVEGSQYQIGLGITMLIENQIIRVGSLRFMKTHNIAIPEIIKKAIRHSHNNGHFLIMVAIDAQIKGAIEIQP